VANNRRPTLLITEGSREIEAATARALAHQGYDVALTYPNKRARAEECADEVRQVGAHAPSSACDITRPDDVTGLYSELLEAAFP